MKIKGNRIFFENGYIQIKVCNNDLDFIVVMSGRTHCYDTLEEAWEKVNERV